MFNTYCFPSGYCFRTRYYRSISFIERISSEKFNDEIISVMKKILHIISSPRGDESFSIKLGKEVLKQLTDIYPGSTVAEVDLLERNVPYLTSGHIRTFFTPTEHLTVEDLETIKYSDAAIDQLMAADIIIIGAPLYNFSIAATLKSWIDHIARPGKTFRYNKEGAEGLVKNKKVYVIISSGAVYSEGKWQSYDFVTSYLKALLGFIGMTDVTFFRAEGLNISGLKDHALEKAIQDINL